MTHRLPVPLGALLVTAALSACSLIPTDDQPRALTPLPEDDGTGDTEAAAAIDTTTGRTAPVCVYLWAPEEEGGRLFPLVVGAVADHEEARLDALLSLGTPDIEALLAGIRRSEADASSSDPSDGGPTTTANDGGPTTTANPNTPLPADLDLQNEAPVGLEVDDVQLGPGSVTVTLSDEIDSVSDPVAMYAQLVYTVTGGRQDLTVKFEAPGENGDPEPESAIVPPQNSVSGPVGRADYFDYRPLPAWEERCESDEEEGTTSVTDATTVDDEVTRPDAATAPARIAQGESDDATTGVSTAEEPEPEADGTGTAVTDDPALPAPETTSTTSTSSTSSPPPTTTVAPASGGSGSTTTTVGSSASTTTTVAG
ncbi:MAG: hypothetical protein S0880_09260 [Actinomycetota bacterium]|nr:hypothetical protein [Actinomycetota bacterium]